MAGIGELVDDKYEILSLVGEGGMSRVYLARDRRLNKLWAVKEINRAADGPGGAVVSQSLVAEANLLKRLDHPMLPRVVDIVEDDRTVLVVMDYVEGKSLRRVLLETGRPMDERAVIDVGAQLCDVLGYLHTRNPPIIYRDMKPGNVMLREDGAVKLIDFGIAREYKEAALADTSILGTRGYAAPEQFARGAQTDARSDVYSLGVTLYALATGRSPADEAFLRPLREVDPRLSEGLEIIVAKATRANPGERYQSCAQMRHDLLNHEKLTEGYRQGLRRRLRRFNLLRGLAAALGAAAVACLVSSFALKRATYEARLADARAASALAEADGISEAEERCMLAVEADPARPEAYAELVGNVYKADQRFSMEESARLQALMDRHRASIQRSPGYAKLCYDVGILYYVYFEQTGEGEERPYAASAGAQAAQWFGLAADAYDERSAAGAACALTPSERRSAEAYAVIGEFYRRLAQATLEGSEGLVYEEYWGSLVDALRGLSDDDPVMVRLRLCSLIQAAVSSPTHLGGFRRAGVGREAAEGLLAEAVGAARSLADEAAPSERARALCASVVSGEAQATANIEAVYGGAGARAWATETGDAP